MDIYIYNIALTAQCPCSPFGSKSLKPLLALILFGTVVFHPMAGRGHLQRATQRLQAMEGPGDSQLAAFLKEEFCFGYLSASKVQGIAHLSVQDHAQSPRQRLELAGLGSSGTNPQHCHEELMRKLYRQMPHCPRPQDFIASEIG